MFMYIDGDYKYWFGMKPVYELLLEFPRLKYAGVTRDFLKSNISSIISYMKQYPEKATFWKSQLSDADISLMRIDGTFARHEKALKAVSKRKKNHKPC